ncbi:hypothetical protein CsatB_022421 [Cannabis sativa]
MDYFILLFLTFAILLGTSLFLHVIRLPTWLTNKSTWQTGRDPPSPPCIPVIGHLHLLTDMPHHSFARLADRLGPVFLLRLGRVPTLVISSARLAGLVLKTHDHVFASRPQLVAAQYLSFGCSDVTFSRYGPYWRQARKICVTELLSPKRVNSFGIVRVEEINRMLSHITNRCLSSEVVDLSKVLFTLANDILCRVAFGRRFLGDEVGSAGEGQKRHLVRVLAETQELLGGFCIGDFYPEWKWVNSLSGFKRRVEKNLDDLRAVCDEIIEDHSLAVKTTSSLDSREDFVDVLLRVQRRDDLEVPITDDNLKALVLDMFVAGTDTTSATLEWTMTELVRHPKVLKKAQQEVRKIASAAGKVDESQLQYLHYMKAVVKETMRLHPPVPLLVPRESMADCTLDGYDIPAKTRVLINSYAIGRDPKSWENPLEFNPERFEGYNMDVKGTDFKFLPFGGGRRGCPGYNFGLATVELGLALLLCHFDWRLPEGVGADDVDLEEIFGLATRKKTPLIVVPTVKKDYEWKRSDAFVSK